MKPATDTPQERYSTIISCSFFTKYKITIKIIFNIIGALAATPNLLCEFKMAEKKDAKLINNKNGKVILVKKIVKSNLLEFSVNPGAIINTNKGINNSITKTIAKRNMIRKLKISFAKIEDFFFDMDNSEE